MKRPSRDLSSEDIGKVNGLIVTFPIRGNTAEAHCQMTFISRVEGTGRANSLVKYNIATTLSNIAFSGSTPSTNLVREFLDRGDAMSASSPTAPGFHRNSSTSRVENLPWETRRSVTVATKQRALNTLVLNLFSSGAYGGIAPSRYRHDAEFSPGIWLSSVSAWTRTRTLKNVLPETPSFAVPGFQRLSQLHAE